MKAVPIRKYIIEINRTNLEFLEIVKTRLEKDKKNEKGFFNTYEPTFVGYIKENEFKLRRRGFGNITMIPIVKGKFIQDELETKLSLTVKFESVINLMLIFWFMILFMILFGTLKSIASDNFNFGIIVILIMILISYGFVMVTFIYELETIKRYFKNNFYIEIR